MSCSNGNFRAPKQQPTQVSSTSSCSVYFWPACWSAKARRAASDSPSRGTGGRAASAGATSSRPSLITKRSAAIANRPAARGWRQQCCVPPAQRQLQPLRLQSDSAPRVQHRALLPRVGARRAEERARALLPAATSLSRATARRSVRLSGPRVAHAPAAGTAARARLLPAQQPTGRPLAGHWHFPPTWLASRPASWTTVWCG